MLGLFLRRDLLIFRRNMGDLLTMWGFFLLACSLFAIVLGGDFDLLHRVSVVIIWVLLLLSVMLFQERIFLSDERCGFLSDMVVRRLLTFYIFSKFASFYLVLVLSLFLILPLLFILLGLGLEFLFGFYIFIFLGLGSLCLLVILGSCLVIGLGMGYLLLPVLLFPLALPVLLFGYFGSVGILGGEFEVGSFLFLLGYFLLNLVICPYFCCLLLGKKI